MNRGHLRGAALLTFALVRRGRREDDDVVLALEVRRRVHAVVVQYPGVHLSEAARAAQLGLNHAKYHLDYLVRAGLVTSLADGGYTRYYPRAREGLPRDVHGAEDKRALAELRRPARLRVVLLLLRHGSLSLRELVERTGMSASTLSFHLERLVERGIVLRLGASKADRRFGLARPEATLRLLLENPPRRDLVAAFIDLWDGLALPPPAGARPGPTPAPAPAAADVAPASPDTPEAPPKDLGPIPVVPARWRLRLEEILRCLFPHHAIAYT